MKRKVVTITKKYSLQIFTMAALLALLAAPCAYATGTASGTSISNTATIGYSVNSVSQTPITSAPAAFVVDDKVDLTVTHVESSAVTVTPGGSGFVLTFRLTNTGNTTHDFILTPMALTNGTYTVWSSNDVTDVFDAGTVHAYVDGNSDGAWQPGETQTYVDELAEDASITVFIVADNIPAAQLDGQQAAYVLTAQAAAGGTTGTLGAASVNDSGADVPGTVQVVFADGNGSDDAAHDGTFSARSAYVVASSHLAVTKTPTVISDPINGVTNPKAIPNAIVEYIINVSNTGSKQADTVVITDQIPANTTFEGTISAPNSDTNTGTVEYSSDIGVVPPALPTNWSASPPSPLSNTTWVRCTHTKVDPTTGWGRMIFRVTIN